MAPQPSLTREEIESIRAEFFAEDIEPLLPDMYYWSREDVSNFFESEGKVRPLDKSMDMSKYRRFRVTFAPRIAVRRHASVTAAPLGLLLTGEVFAGKVSSDANWLQLRDGKYEGGFVMVVHPEHGRLVEPEKDSAAGEVEKSHATGHEKLRSEEENAPKNNALKKQIATQVTQKACGINLKTADAAGVSRDSLFDHFVRQELVIDFQQSFRLEGIPDNMYDTDYADDTEAITWCVMGGQLGPVPLKKGGRKQAVGGMRQRIEWLGGLRCIIAERDEGSDEPPVLVVVLAHGINVLSDDLFGLAYFCGTFGDGGMPRVRFVIPGGPEECEKPQEMLRAPRRWFEWSEATSAATAEANMKKNLPLFINCANAALEHAPNARLALCGFSQGAFVSLYAACMGLKPAALIQLCGQAPFSDLPTGALDGVSLLVAAGSLDPIAPVSTAEQLLVSCHKAGAVADEPLFCFDGEHDVTQEVATKVAEFLAQLLTKN